MAAGEGGMEREYRKVRKVPRGMTVVMGFLMGNSLLQLARTHHVMPKWVSAALAGFHVLLLAHTALCTRRGRTLVGPHGITAPLWVPLAAFALLAALLHWRWEAQVPAAPRSP
ncbi:hypothetical protein [Streptomyces sp. NPDC051636]|uniref:hypothetical protein n=1 Tax=Streptomyces sp. NPDC051636 TaxID=3365663 RepID=UPI0037B394FC